MPFIATTAAGSETSISNDFWPAISLTDARNVIRIEQDVTDPRLQHLLQIAIADVNDELAQYTAEQQQLGNTINELSLTVQARYLQAIYAHTTASLLEQYQDYDATGQRGESKNSIQQQVDAQRRQVATAIRAILGKPRSCVELI
ncbi:head completion/stabilization protein [Oceanobacter kriegii]|uniref:head completion/stabilization protein n=1 Tax=Oceanobacter kriegii TaxID=64972 RepID=UPI000421709C|nr:head completion/stabilization protein [Oceanobacter kriegii]